MRILKITAALALAGALLLPSAVMAKTFITIGTGGTRGTYYPTGGAMAKVLSEKLPGVEANTQTTGASVQNCQLLGAKQIEMGMTTSNIAFKAYNGLKPFKQKEPVMTLFAMFASEMQIITVKSRGIKTMADLEGKRISLGPPGGGAAVLAEVILKAYGLWDKVDKQFLGFGASTTAIKDGNLDAALIYAPSPASTILDLASSEPVHAIPLDPKIIEKIHKKHPYFLAGVLKKGTYRGIDEDVPMIICLSIMAVRKDMPAELAYKITKTIFENMNYLRTVHRVMQQTTPQNAVRAPIPMHPGAIKYFKEVGALK